MAILDDKSLDFVSSSVEQTVRLGVRLGELLQLGDVVCLSGDLGAGKTAMARGIGRGWGTSLRITSPTFTLVNEYPRARDGLVLYHLDCYRLALAAANGEAATAEWVTAGFETLLEDGVTLMVEWPERILSHLPADRLWIQLRYVNETRRGLRFSASGSRSEQLLQEFRRNAFGV
ncbi:MAG: tRNA (adenosine(37)-N6)-threonylcarbamoyltransferase complex ATPase subunit type 1 TsaE [Anaerolineae bacterium]|nr:tRNA (adenosine(37)-N6)-threonylcarbamoyltransferase complex ATPase subunit type 1 TsaE [Anaerolineae bacterium]